MVICQLCKIHFGNIEAIYAGFHFGILAGFRGDQTVNLAKGMGIEPKLLRECCHTLSRFAINDLLMNNLPSTDIRDHRAVVIEYIVIFRGQM
ncbi:Uncharacterised protein [Vibrio cholerae]|nr:Uncharacterised protein [Vibrio cholerae]